MSSRATSPPVSDAVATGAATGRADLPVIAGEGLENWACDGPVELGGGGTGRSLIHPDWPCERLDPGAIVRTGDGGRETRRVHERSRRVYRFSIPVLPGSADSGGEFVTLTDLLRVASAGGWVRWRHNKDDPPVSAENPITATPLWRVRVEGEITRQTGGAHAAVALRFEEV